MSSRSTRSSSLERSVEISEENIIEPEFLDQINTMEKVKNYELYEDRVSSFSTVNWNGDLTLPHRMAKAGLYFFGHHNQVKCAFCSNIFVGWYNRGKNLTVTHKKKVPGCKYFTKQEDIFIEDRIFFFIQSVGVLPVIKVPEKNVKYITIESRLQSFEKYKKKLLVDLRTICEAGFFFISVENKNVFQCFCCKLKIEVQLTLHKIDIWKVHARGRPLCTYVLLNKGKEFVMDVFGGNYNVPEIQYKCFSKLISYQAEFDETEYRLISWKPKYIKRIRDLKPSVRTECGKQGNSTEDSIPEGLLCKICVKEKMEVLSMPCGHIFACIPCVVTVSECSICRCSFSMLMKINLDFNRKVESTNPLKKACTSAAIQFDEDFDPLLCQVCQKLEIQVALAPCMHVYCCFECAIESKECLICSLKVISFIYVYL